MITYETPKPRRFGYVCHNKLNIGPRKYDLNRITDASRQRVQLVLNSDTIEKNVEFDEDMTPTIYFWSYPTAPKAKELGAASVEIAPIPPVPAVPPVVEIPAPKTRPGTRFINGVIDYGTVGVAPIFREAWYLEMTKK